MARKMKCPLIGAAIANILHSGKPRMEMDLVVVTSSVHLEKTSPTISQMPNPSGNETPNKDPFPRVTGTGMDVLIKEDCEHEVLGPWAWLMEIRYKTA